MAGAGIRVARTHYSVWDAGVERYADGSSAWIARLGRVRIVVSWG